jgi:hypothetical protein
MGGMAALMLLFVWLKVGHVFDLSWWWILTPPLVCLADGFWTGMFDEWNKSRYRL